MDITTYFSSRREAALLVGDYSSYQSQCSRRIHTLRKKFGRTTPRNAKYSAKAPISAEDITKSIEYVHLQVLMAERAWGGAMAMKAAHAEDNADKSITGSTRRHIISKLNKASKFAKHLAATLSDAASEATELDRLEAQAYYSSLLGAEEFEKQAEGSKRSDADAKRWNACLEYFSAARLIYNALHKSTKKDVFRDVLSSSIDPSIRYAAYQSHISRTVPVPTVAKQRFPKTSQSELAEVVQKLDSEAFEDEAAPGAPTKPGAEAIPKTISWRGRRANVVDAAIGQALAAINAAERKLTSYLNSPAGKSAMAREKAAAYDEILLASQDAADATRHAIEELEREGADEGDARMQDLRVGSLAVNYQLIEWRVGRNRTLIGEDDGMRLQQAAEKGHGKKRRKRKGNKKSAGPQREESTGKRLARLRERVVLYDAILQSIDSVKELPGATRDPSFVGELDARRAYFQSLKCLNIAHSHAALSHPREALALFARALDLSSQATALSPPPSIAPTSLTTGPTDPPKLTVRPVQAEALRKHLSNLTNRYRALVHLHDLAARDERSAAASRPSPSSGALPAGPPLVERLGEYPASGTVDLGNIVTYPPRVRPVPVKPLFFDVAWNYIEYPGRAKDIKAAAVTGVSDEMDAEGTDAAEEERKPAKKGWFGFGR